MSFITKLLGGGQGKKAAAETLRASQVAKGAQTEALGYLKEADQVPRGIMEGALEGLGGYFGIPGYGNTQQQVIDEAKSSPLYQAILGSRKSVEDAIMRNASATGGLRSGNTNAVLTDYNMGLENTALLESLNQRLAGLTGLSRTPTNTNNIAQLTSDIGMTEAQGITGAAQAKQQGSQNVMNNLLGIGKLGLQFAGLPAGSFSDLRLKENIRFMGWRNGHKWYRWDWLPEAAALGLDGTSEGVLAHHIFESNPEAVGLFEGFLVVNYDALGLEVAI